MLALTDKGHSLAHDALMIKTFAAMDARSPLVPFNISRRELKPADVLVRIEFCGVCHSDLHQARNEWGNSMFPMVPGHEIVGRVEKVGRDVSSFKVGDSVGVGCLVDSCRTCSSCSKGLEQYCEQGWVGTYNSLERDGKTPTFGGYSTHIVVDSAFVLRVPPNMDLARTAPLLCAGITTYSPLKAWGVGPGQKVGVMGLGGLGHVAIRLARSMGAHVVAFTSSTTKVEDALRLGANEVVLSRDPSAFKKHSSTLNLTLDTISAPHDLNPYLDCVAQDGTLVMLGVPDRAPELHPFPLIMKRRRIAGSLIGGIAETQEMLNHCAKTGVLSDIEVLPISKVNLAYERLAKADVKYRFVLDLAELHSKS